MFEQDMLENLEAMKVAAQKQKALVQSVLSVEVSNKNILENMEKKFNLMDQIAEIDVAIDSINEIFRCTEYLKEFQEKFEKLV